MRAFVCLHTYEVYSERLVTVLEHLPGRVMSEMKYEDARIQRYLFANDIKFVHGH